MADRSYFTSWRISAAPCQHGTEIVLHRFGQPCLIQVHAEDIGVLQDGTQLMGEGIGLSEGYVRQQRLQLGKQGIRTHRHRLTGIVYSQQIAAPAGKDQRDIPQLHHGEAAFPVTAQGAAVAHW